MGLISPMASAWTCPNASATRRSARRIQSEPSLIRIVMREIGTLLFITTLICRAALYVITAHYHILGGDPTAPLRDLGVLAGSTWTNKVGAGGAGLAVDIESGGGERCMAESLLYQVDRRTSVHSV